MEGGRFDSERTALAEHILDECVVDVPQIDRPPVRAFEFPRDARFA